MSNITITVTDKVAVASPYNQEFVSGARNLGGKWDGSSKAWKFDVRDEQAVRDLCVEVYGEDGTPTKTVTVRLTALTDIAEYNDSIQVAGREIARAFGRDSGASIGDGIVFIKGSAGSGGSRKNWKTAIREGVVFEIRDLPERSVDRIDTDEYAVEIVTDESESAMRNELERLIADREAINRRIAEIESKLN